MGGGGGFSRETCVPAAGTTNKLQDTLERPIRDCISGEERLVGAGTGLDRHDHPRPRDRFDSGSTLGLLFVMYSRIMLLLFSSTARNRSRDAPGLHYLWYVHMRFARFENSA